MAIRKRGQTRLLSEADFVSIEQAGIDRRSGGRAPKWSAHLKLGLNAQLTKHCNSVISYRQIDELDVQTLHAKSRKKMLTAFDLLESCRRGLLEGGANVIVNHRWKTFYEAFDRVRPLIETPRKGGRKGNRWLDEFIMIVAKAYQRAGGNVSAEPKADRSLETPFLRVLRIVFQRLPKHLQGGTPLSALDARARRVTRRAANLCKIASAF
jgi:hypothetical protein